jgi:hypothetical protein
LSTGSIGHIGTNPGIESAVGFGMLLTPEGRGHIDNSFNQFGLGDGGSGITTLKFWASQAVAAF